MAGIQRTAEAEWKGNLREGSGTITSPSGVLTSTPYSFGTRFENTPGTNPEELVAAAHAACYSMAFANTLAEKGYDPQSIQTRAIATLTVGEAGARITKMRLITRGKVPGLDAETFAQIAVEAERGCPVSNALRAVPVIEVEATLE
jgi:osmotically inducible protein OsmC